MVFKVLWDTRALKDLKKIDKEAARVIVTRVKQYLAEDPFYFGKPLKKQFKGLYRYRFENYRVIYAIEKEKLIIKVVAVGHRKNVYK